MMLQSLISAVILLCISHQISGQLINGGACPAQVTAMLEFDITQFYGEWYEVEKIGNLFESKVICNAANYSALPNGHIMVNNTGTRNGKLVTTVGDATIPNAAVPSKLTINFPNFPITANYWILDTDYSGIAVVWSCSDIGFANFEFAWIMSRQQSPLSPGQRAYVDVVLQANGINKSLFSTTTQTGCAN